MAVTHDYECRAHGVFESRAKNPRCPFGCSKSFVTRVYLRPFAIGSGKAAKADAMLKAAAASQGLSDVSTSPSRPGDSVMQRLRARHNREFQREQLANWGGEAGRLLSQLDGKQILAGTARGPDTLSSLGFGKAYNPGEWHDTKDGRKVHNPQPRYPDFKPPADVERVRGGK